MSKSSDEPFRRVEVITSVQRRRRWSVAEKVRLVEEAMQPGMSVSYVARRAGISPSQLFAWKRRMLEGGHAAVQADEDVGIEPAAPGPEDRQVRRVGGLLERAQVDLQARTAARDYDLDPFADNAPQMVVVLDLQLSHPDLTGHVVGGVGKHLATGIGNARFQDGERQH